MGYTKYAWVGNRISDIDMADLYRMKLRTPPDNSAGG